jgi:phage baseplate assembly protein V
MNAAILDRFLQPIRNKIFLLVGRAILAAIKNSEKTMKIQVKGLSGEVITDIERVQNYGFESYPIVGSSEAVVLFVNGNRDQGVAVCVHDREYRPTDLASGDVAVYSKADKSSPCRIVLKANGDIIFNNGAESMVLGDKLKSWFDTFTSDFNKHVHTCAAPGSPSSPPMSPPAVPMIIMSPTDILSDNIKVK